MADFESVTPTPNGQPETSGNVDLHHGNDRGSRSENSRTRKEADAGVGLGFAHGTVDTHEASVRDVVQGAATFAKALAHTVKQDIQNEENKLRDESCGKLCRQ